MIKFIKKALVVLGLALFLTLAFLIGSISKTVSAEAPLGDPILIPDDVAQHPWKAFAYEKVVTKWGEGEWKAFERIIQKESSWKVTGSHGHAISNASGLCGFLGSTWETTQFEKTDDPYIQILACIQYAEKRYGTPTEGLSFHIREGWW